MTFRSESFEKQIHRIHSLLEQEGSSVTWNDKVQDPDNPDRTRQIDISIRRDGQLTLVECRLHKRTQDVNWIEELIGRRASLKADAVIAVSASGFTEGAKRKSRTHGVILRDLVGLTEEEIRHWGHQTKVSLTFLQFEKMKIDLVIGSHRATAPSSDEVFAELQRNTTSLYKILDIATKEIETKNPKLEKCSFDFEFTTDALPVLNSQIKRVKISASISKLVQALTIPSVVAYDAPEVSATQRSAKIEKDERGHFEITKSSNRVVVAADLSSIQIPKNCRFMYFGFDFGRQVSMESFELLGLPPFRVLIQGLDLGVVVSH